MNVNLELPEELDAVVRRRAAAAGQDVSTFLRQMVEENLAEEEEVASSQSVEDFAKRLDAWIALHPVLDHAIDDSRESIYSGRGE